MMTKCPKCGADNLKGETFCANCGLRAGLLIAVAPAAIAAPSYHASKKLMIIGIVIAIVVVIVAAFLLTQRLPMTDDNIRAGHPVVCQLPEPIANGSIIIMKLSYPKYRFEESDPEFPGQENIRMQSASGKGYVYSPLTFGNFWWEAPAGYNDSLRWLLTPDAAIIIALHSKDMESKPIDMRCSFVSSIPDSEFEPPVGAPIRPYSEDAMGRI